MPVITVTVASLYVAQKCLDQFIKEEGYGRFKSYFFPKKKYVNQLIIVINNTVSEYEKLYAFNKTENKIAFYHSKVLFEELLKHLLFKKIDSTRYLDLFDNDKRILIPTKTQLEQFFELFISKINADDKLNKLFKEENYQNEIFVISSNVDSLHNKVDQINNKSDRILEGMVGIIELLTKSDNLFLTPDYIARSEEEGLWQQLNQKDVLLLSGLSFCGKSELAKRLANRLIESGYKLFHRNDIDEAQRALLNTTANTVLLLEDPCGHNASSESKNNYRKLEQLIKNKPVWIKIIVTSRTEIVKSITQKAELSEVAIEGHEWIDLTTTDSAFLVKTWEQLGKRKNIDDKVFNIINEYLKKPNQHNLLQPGQLNHLSNLPPQKLQNTTLEQLLFLAKSDSREIAIEIESRGALAFKLFLSLGLTADTVLPVDFDTLAYMLSEPEELIGLFKESLGLSIFDYRSNKDKPLNYPQYKEPLAISNEYMQELGFLQARGFILIDNKKISFCHPTYREAARFLSTMERVDLIPITEKFIASALSCLNSSSAINAAKQLKIILSNIKSGGFIDFIKNTAFKFSTMAMFPGVRDICFTLLLENIDALSNGMKTNVLSQVRIKSSWMEIRWMGEVPYYEKDYNNYFDDLDKETDIHSVEKWVEIINKGGNISKSQIWDLLVYYGSNSGPLPNETGIIQLLKSDEVFIRNKVAFHFFRLFFPGQKVVDTVFADIHPSVIYQGLKGAIIGYPSYSDEDREKIKPVLINALSQKLVVIRSNEFLSTFGIDYGSESFDWSRISTENKKEIWKLWAILFPVFLRNYPENLRFSNTGRFGQTLDKSIEYLSPEEGLELCEAYYEWLIKYMINERLPDTFEFAILPYLMDITKGREAIRFDLFRRIFSHADTGFITFSFSWCFGYWDNMTQEEKNFILKVLQVERIDKRWIFAVCITQKNCPVEIQKLITGHITKDLDTENLVKTLEPQLLRDCLSVFCGHPQPLWWLGFHHNDREVWYKVILWILWNEHENGFDVCLRELVNDAVNGLSDHWKKEGKEVWEHLCKTSTNKKRLAKQLIFETSRCTCVVKSTKAFWRPLIDSYLLSNVDELVEMIVENLEFLQYSHPEDLLKFFDNGFLEERILPKLPLDSIVMGMLWGIKKSQLDGENLDLLIELILQVSTIEKLRLSVVADNLDYAIEKNGEQFASIKKLENLPRYINADLDSRYVRLDDDYLLDNWVSVTLPRQLEE